MATIEHKNSRLHGPRPPARGEETLTLFCFKCNNDTNAEAQRQVPIEELHRRSGRSRRDFGGIGRALPSLQSIERKVLR